MIWLKNNWRYLLITAVFASVVAVSYQAGSDKVQAKWDDEKLTQAQEQAKQKDKVITVEREQVKESVKISEDYQKGLNDGKNELQTAINRLTVERDRLRQQQSNSKQPVPTIDTGAGGHNATERGDFLVTHGEDALRLANEADDVVKQLKACQNQLDSDRAALNVKGKLF